MNDQSSPMPAEKGPLDGCRVLVTRPGQGALRLGEMLKGLGAEFESHPVIEISGAPDEERARSIRCRLNQFSILAFLSANAAAGAADSFGELFRQSPGSDTILVAIGQGTKKILEDRGFRVHHVPAESNSESMAQLLIEKVRELENPRPVLILRADRGSDVLAKSLADAKVDFDQLAIYQSRDVTEASPEVLHGLSAGNYDWLTITSSAIAKNVARLFGEHVGNTKIVSISPTTTRAATDAGLKVSAEATEYNMEGLVEAIVRHRQADDRHR